jgi:hypothetical protein
MREKHRITARETQSPIASRATPPTPVVVARVAIL